MESNSINEGWVLDGPEVSPSRRPPKSAPLESHGRLYVQLLEDSRLSAMAKLCFGTMGSFGRESRASVRSIARRMGVAENTVRRAQKTLEAAGWAKFLGQDEWGLKHWALAHPAKDEGVGSKAPKPPPDVGEPPGVQELKVKQEDNLEHKQEQKDPGAVGAGEALKRHQERYYATTGKHYIELNRDRKAAGQLFKAHRISQSELDHAIENFFKDPERYTGGHSARHLYENFNAYRLGPIDRGGAHQRRSDAGHGPERGQGGGIHPGRPGSTGKAGGGRRKDHGPALG